MNELRNDKNRRLSPEAQRLLSSANAVRPMNATERAKATAFIEELSQRQRRTWSLRLPHLFLGIAIACILIGVSLLRSNQENMTVEPEPVPKDVSTPKPAPSLAWTPGPMESQATNGSSGENPGLGDICGQHVCASMPSCCEDSWNEACDAELLRLTRTPGVGVTTHVGRCYWHDREICPGCACPMYLKRYEQFSRNGVEAISVGYDGGSGCLKSRQRLLEELAWMCTEGFCEE